MTTLKIRNVWDKELTNTPKDRCATEIEIANYEKYITLYGGDKRK